MWAQIKSGLGIALAQFGQVAAVGDVRLDLEEDSEHVRHDEGSARAARWPLPQREDTIGLGAEVLVVELDTDEPAILDTAADLVHRLLGLQPGFT